MADDEDDDLLKPLSMRDDVSTDKMIVLLEERQHQIIRRLKILEKSHTDMTALVNKGIGGIGVILGIGVIMGWAASLGDKITSWFRGHS